VPWAQWPVQACPRPLAALPQTNIAALTWTIVLNGEEGSGVEWRD